MDRFGVKRAALKLSQKYCFTAPAHGPTISCKGQAENLWPLRAEQALAVVNQRGAEERGAGMSLSEDFLSSGEIHPIDIVETLATDQDWDFDRVTDDQIAMAVEGQWRTYSLTLAWSAPEETLRLISTFEFDPPAEKLPVVLDLINRANDMVWSGAFTWWAEQRMMVWRYGLVLAGHQIATPEQIDRMIGQAVAASERFYPAFQLAAWGDDSAERAIRVAMAEAYGRA